MIRLSEIHQLARTLEFDDYGLRDAAELAPHRPLPLALPRLNTEELSRLPEPDFCEIEQHFLSVKLRLT